MPSLRCDRFVTATAFQSDVVQAFRLRSRTIHASNGVARPSAFGAKRQACRWTRRDRGLAVRPRFTCQKSGLSSNPANWDLSGCLGELV